MPWTEADIPDLSTKTVLITGANTGVGFEAARLFAKHGAQVVLVCRTASKMSAAAEAIRAETPSARLQELQCDLSDLATVRSCGDRFARLAIPTLDVVLLNAGAVHVEYATSAQGNELMFATNYLGHYLLTGLLLPFMKDVPGSRVIAVSSVAHRLVEDINFEVARGNARESFRYKKVYAETKLAMHWFVGMLTEKLEACDAKTIAVAAAPGVTLTELGRNITGFFSQLAILPFTLVRHSARSAAQSYVFAATDLEVKKGNYYEPGSWWGMKGSPVSNGYVTKAGQDAAKAFALWKLSEELTSFQYAM